MCDYSMEHLKSVKAQVGETYKLVSCITHGFITEGSAQAASSRGVTAVCCTHGQRLHLSDVLVHGGYVFGGVPNDMVVTFRQRKADPARREDYQQFGGFNDGIELPDGRVFPLAYLVNATMRLLPAEQKKSPYVDDLLTSRVPRPELIDA